MDVFFIYVLDPFIFYSILNLSKCRFPTSGILIPCIDKNMSTITISEEHGQMVRPGILLSVYEIRFSLSHTPLFSVVVTHGPKNKKSTKFLTSSSLIISVGLN